MTKQSSKKMILQGRCSQCRHEFRGRQTRFVIGYFPADQFCSFECMELFLEKDDGRTRAVSLPYSLDGWNGPRHHT